MKWYKQRLHVPVNGMLTHLYSHRTGKSALRFERDPVPMWGCTARQVLHHASASLSNPSEVPASTFGCLVLGLSTRCVGSVVGP